MLVIVYIEPFKAQTLTKIYIQKLLHFHARLFIQHIFIKNSTVKSHRKTKSFSRILSTNKINANMNTINEMKVNEITVQVAALRPLQQCIK